MLLTHVARIGNSSFCLQNWLCACASGKIHGGLNPLTWWKDCIASGLAPVAMVCVAAQNALWAAHYLLQTPDARIWCTWSRRKHRQANHQACLRVAGTWYAHLARSSGIPDSCHPLWRFDSSYNCCPFLCPLCSAAFRTFKTCKLKWQQ